MHRPAFLSLPAGRLARAAAAAAGMALAAAVVPAGMASAAPAKPRPPVLAFSPAPYNYGQVAAGQAASHTFTLANTGGQATGKLAVTLAGAAAFTITGGTCHNRAPGTRCTVTVRFTPARAGTVTAMLTAASNKPHVTATDAVTGSGGLGAAPGHLYWTDQFGRIGVAPLTPAAPRPPWSPASPPRPGWQSTPATSTGPTPASRASRARSGRPR